MPLASDADDATDRIGSFEDAQHDDLPSSIDSRLQIDPRERQRHADVGRVGIIAS